MVHGTDKDIIYVIFYPQNTNEFQIKKVILINLMSSKSKSIYF